MSAEMLNVRRQISQWISQISYPNTRENALHELNSIRYFVDNFAPMLWFRSGITDALLQEIFSIYPAISPPTLTAEQSIRVCKALDLLQCFASHPTTHKAFLRSTMALHVYPFLSSTCATLPFEILRLTSLGVIGALVKTDAQEVVTFLLTTEIIPLCLRIMENGSELSKIVSTFIIHNILLDEVGLMFICESYDRFTHVTYVLYKMTIKLSKEPCTRLLHLVISCYLRLSENPRARVSLRSCLPEQLRDNTFSNLLQDDKLSKLCLQTLIQNIGIKGGGASKFAFDVGPFSGFGPWLEFYVQPLHLDQPQPQSATAAADPDKIYEVPCAF